MQQISISDTSLVLFHSNGGSVLDRYLRYVKQKKKALRCWEESLSCSEKVRAVTTSGPSSFGDKCSADTIIKIKIIKPGENKCRLPYLTVEEINNTKPTTKC